MITCLGGPWISTDSDQIGDLDWQPWGFGMAFALVYIISLPNEDGNSIADKNLMPFLTSASSAILLLWYILQFVEEGKRDPTTDLGFSSALLTTLPGLINAVKLWPVDGPLIVAVADVVCNFANLWVVIFQANSLSSPALLA